MDIIRKAKWTCVSAALTALVAAPVYADDTELLQLIRARADISRNEVLRCRGTGSYRTETTSCATSFTTGPRSNPPHERAA